METTRKQFLKLAGGIVASAFLIDWKDVKSTSEQLDNQKKVLYSINASGHITQTYGVPDGWMECDGRKIDRKKHPELYEICRPYGFRLPDLRGSSIMDREEVV